MPIAADSLVLFIVDLHGIDDIPEEYASDQEESYGSVTFDALPCGNGGDELAFTVDGALGAETNPGFVSAVVVTGSVRLPETGEPPADLFGSDG